MVHERVELLRPDDAGDRRALRDRPRHPVGGPRGRRPGLLPVRHERRPHLRLLPEPLRATALVHDVLRGDRPEPRAPLQGDGLRLRAREDRGVHVGRAVPGVRGCAPAARVAGGEGRRPRHPRGHADVRAARDRLVRGARALRHRAPDRAPDPARDRRAAPLSGQRRRRVPVARARGGHALRRRGAADPAGHPDRVEPRRRALHPRRAVDRAAPARQHAADPHARAAARPRQHGDRGRARRGHDARGGPPRRPGPGRRRARRPPRRGGNAGRGDAQRRLAHRPVPGGQAGDPGSGQAPAAGGLHRDREGRAAQPEGAST